MTTDRRTVATFGMWVFIASEGMLFAGLFALYAAYHHAFPDEIAAAARHANRTLGTLNTYILITSSFTIAVAIHQARAGLRYRAWIAATVAFGVAFEIIKGIEYAQHLSEGFAPGGHYAFAGLP
ncbi:MAG TPA: cytochrome c oxidase subunit 3, partial [Kofleriaceae bacterium]